jgi:APA family basic amino acid/polyamine antiporter
MSLGTQFAMSLLFVYVGYSGWNAATYIAEELRHPERTLPIALTFGTLLVTVLYLGLNMVFIYGAPLESMKGVVAVGALAASRLFGPEIAGLFSGLMAVGLMSTVNAMVTVGPRVYYAMAKNGAFFPAAAHVHPRWHTPIAAILWQGAAAMLMTLIPLGLLFVYIGMLLNFFAVMAVASLFVYRRRPGWQKLGVVSFAWPLVPGVFILVGLWIALNGLIRGGVVTVSVLATVAAGALVYHFRLRSSGGSSEALDGAR